MKKIFWFIVRLFNLNSVFRAYAKDAPDFYDAVYYVQNKDGSKTPCRLNRFPVVPDAMPDGNEYYQEMRKRGLKWGEGIADSYAKICVIVRRVRAMQHIVDNPGNDRLAEIFTDFEDGRPLWKCRFSFVPIKYISLS